MCEKNLDINATLRQQLAFLLSLAAPQKMAIYSTCLLCYQIFFFAVASDIHIYNYLMKLVYNHGM